MVENIDTIIAEFRSNRVLTTIKIILHGPPASGKTALAKLIASTYKLHHIHVSDVIQEAIANAVSLSLSLSPSRPTTEHLWRNLLCNLNFSFPRPITHKIFQDEETKESIKDEKERNNGKIPDEQLVQMFKDKLLGWQCQNQGFVLDGFPKMYKQAEALFAGILFYIFLFFVIFFHHDRIFSFLYFFFFTIFNV
jgi:adenylate kinase